MVGEIHGFAPPLTSFVGRSTALREVADVVADHRLVTVTGPGGVGKTRLAAEVARRVAGRFADGAWLVELAAVREPALVAPAVAKALGILQAPGEPVLDSLARVLASRQLLLVLDNCEHLAEAAAELCAALLPAADDARILATSREPIGVAGETRYRLPPLALPEKGGPAREDPSESVALFADRARQVEPHFTLAGESGALVMRLVARLDGMPLAIELAAARVEALGVAQLLDRLDERLALLIGPDRLAPGRQRSLAATVDWSYQLLSPREQLVFRRLSVFPAPFTLRAAEIVARKGAGPAVLQLVDCSMVSPPHTGPDGQARYSMLETLRAFGADRLADAGEQAEATAALAHYAVLVGEEALTGMQASAAEPTTALKLDADDANVHQALAWALEHDHAAALRLAVALAPWWRLRGRAVAGSALLRRAASHGEEGSGLWCAAQFLLGQAAVGTGDTPAALGHFTAVIDAVGDQVATPILADCLSGRAHSLLNLGRTSEGADEASRALSMAREIGYPAGQALALLELGLAAFYAADHENALAWAHLAQRVDPEGVPGWIARLSSTYLTLFLMAAGDIASARRTCADGLARARQAGSLQDQADCLQLLADLDRQSGHYAEAAEHLREALELASQIGSRGHLIDCLDYGGLLCAATGRSADAVTLWAARSARLQDAGMPDAPRDAKRREELMRRAKEELGPERTRLADERGSGMVLATASEFASMLVSTPTSMQPQHPQVKTHKLSARELELVALVAQGRTDTQIAGQLYISVRTVRSHLDHIRDKTGYRRRADLTRLALQAGLV